MEILGIKHFYETGKISTNTRGDEGSGGNDDERRENVERGTSRGIWSSKEGSNDREWEVPVDW